MSQWTHVNATIRFDGIPGMTPDPDLGRTVEFDDPQEMWNKCNVPCGSEGSLRYEITEVGDGVTRFVAAIWGDLRSYSDVAEIEAYLTRITTGQMIRSGVAEIEVEYKTVKVLRFNSDLDVQAWQTVWEQSAEAALPDSDIAE